MRAYIEKMFIIKITYLNIILQIDNMTSWKIQFLLLLLLLAYYYIYYIFLCDFVSLRALTLHLHTFFQIPEMDS